MLTEVYKYEVFPSVYKANETAEVTVTANERSMIFTDGDEFTVRVIAVDGEYDSIYRGATDYTVKAKDGVLRWTHPFLDEQEYRIILLKDETSVFETSVFALMPDLYELVPLMGDLHSHSTRSDGRQDPLSLAGYIRQHGYDFYAMTDHNRFYPSEEVREALAGVNSGLVVLTGEEVHGPSEMPIHIVHVGGKDSVDKIYVKNREEYDKELSEYKERVPAFVADKYRERYAIAMWASDHIHAVGGLAIFPHPFWRPGKWSRRYMSAEFATLMMKSGLFDAYELLGAMGQQGVNESVTLWNDLRAEGLNIPVVGSSDVHSVKASPEFPCHRTVLFAKEKNEESILRAIKDGMSVAVEISYSESTTQYRGYGSLRLVNYAQFLMRYYFNKISLLAYGEGNALRAYFLHDAPAELVNLEADRTRTFTARFFGKEPAPIPTAELLASVGKYNEIHKDYVV